MLANFHTHTVFCDGKNTPEEIILFAIERGFSAIGFSGHSRTDFDLRYCMKDCDGYITEINRLKQKYKEKIPVYLGIEEDFFAPVNRSSFDYLIGSSHYFCIDGRYYSIDFNYDCFKDCLAVFDYDIIRLSEVYYRQFCDYINFRKPDIIGHFDLITKFDEMESSLLLHNANYNRLSEMYIAEAAKSGGVFEINTGAISRGLRTTPYPSENLLYVLKKLDAPLILSSDSHSIDTLDLGFDDVKHCLKHIGFTHLFTIYDGKFVKYNI